MPPGLTYRDDVSGPRDCAPVYALLRDVFGFDASLLGEFDLWDPTYRAFAYLDGAGACAASAAACALPLIIAGRRVDAMGVQSVATRPDWRGRGLAHDLLDRVLRRCDAQAPLTFLMTSIPGFYEPMGFRVVPQHAFAGAAPAPAAPIPRNGRRLDLAEAADRRLMVQVLRRRSPVSARVAVVSPAGHFALNVMGEPDLAVWHLAAHDALVVTAERPGGALRIVDIAAPRMPRLADVLAALGTRPETIEVRFPPDQLGWAGAAIPADTPTVLMVRGDPGPLSPFMIPETAAF